MPIQVVVRPGTDFLKKKSYWYVQFFTYVAFKKSNPDFIHLILKLAIFAT